jgi:hypothetical protein
VETSWFDLLLLVGFTARLIRLVVVDDIGGPLRDLIRLLGAWAGGDRGLVWADGLVRCPFCIGFWISVAVVASYAAAGSTGWWTATAGVFTLSYLAGHAVRFLDVGDDDD